MVARLGDIAYIAAGQGAPQGMENYSEYGTPFVKAGNLVELINGTSENDIQKVTSEVAEKYKLKLFPKDTVVFAKSGMSCMKGYVHKLTMDSYVVSHLACITPYKIEADYLKYYFEYHKPNQLVKDEAYPSISLSDIADLQIDIFNEQKRYKVIKTLDKVNLLIKIRKNQLSKLDELVKSRFIELFGMVGTDEKGWGLSRLGECCAVNPKKTNDSRLCAELKVSFVPMTSVSEKGEIDTNDIRIYENVKTGFTYFAEEDVLFAKITPCMENGKGAVAKGLCNGIGFGSTEFHVLRPIEGISNPYWLYVLTTFEQFRKDAENNMTGSAGQRRVPASFLENYRVAVPPVELQNQFAAFVEQTEKSKLAIQQSLEQLETLKKSLMQQYFG